MDGVLVHQTAPSGFDRMPWMPDGRQLWEFIKGYRPTLLTSVADERFGDTCREKLAWIDRELGRDVPVIFAPKSRGKWRYCIAGAVLIDDSDRHCAEWNQAGGFAIGYRSTVETISVLRAILNPQSSILGARRVTGR